MTERHVPNLGEIVQGDGKLWAVIRHEARGDLALVLLCEAGPDLAPVYAVPAFRIIWRGEDGNGTPPHWHLFIEPQSKIIVVP